MALTIAKNDNLRGFLDLTLMAHRDLKMVPITIAFDNSYPTGGEAFSFSGVNHIVNVMIEPAGAYTFVYDYTNDKIQVFVSATGLEVADATDLSALTGIHALLIGY